MAIYTIFAGTPEISFTDCEASHNYVETPMLDEQEKRKIKVYREEVEIQLANGSLVRVLEKLMFR